ncbi:Tripartite tricarboxylate transporter family receptor [compost metagenome]
MQRRSLPSLCLGLTATTMATTIAATIAAPAFAQEHWPAKPVTIVVPFPAGGMTDLLARRIARDMQAELKQPFVVDNRAGASGQIGTEIVARANPDGYTLLVSATHHVINPAIRPKLPYNASKDFTNIALLATTPNVLVVNNSVPASNLPEFLAYARKQSEGLSYGSSSIGGATHMSGELLRLMTKVPMTHIPYKGASPALADLLGGQIPALFHDVMTMAPYVKDGKVKAIGVTSARRSEALPNVPTIAEQGVPGYEATTWIGFYGPANLPRPLVEKLNREAVKSMNSAEAKTYLTQNGTSPGALNAEQFGSFVQAELDKWKRVATEAKVKVD